MEAKYRNVVVYRLIFLLKFIGTVFVFSIILSHVKAESSIILTKHFSLVQVAGFQI